MDIVEQVSEEYKLPLRENCPYAKNYCEENVWQLCDLIKKNLPEQLDKYFVVFISNESKTIPLWCQKAAAPSGNGDVKDRYVMWDYHVVVLYKSDSDSMIYDLDTTLDFPCDFCTYVTDAIRKLELKEQYQRYFRVIPAEKYLLEFSSDRRHMRRPDGTWMVEQPSWPCIFASSTGHNIEQFWSMDPEIFSDWSTVLSEKDFAIKYSL